MGTIIRLNTAFTNTSLPVLVDYDTSDLEAQILSIPTLRAFFDATNAAYRTESGGKITQLTDRTGNGRHFLQASTSLAPSLEAGIFNGVDGIRFDATDDEMVSTGLFSGANAQSVCAMIYPLGVGGTSQIFLTDKATQGQNFYVGGTTDIRALNAGVSLSIPSLGSKFINYICGFNISGNVSRIYGDALSATGTVGGMTAPTGDANLGRWADGQAANKYGGYIGHVMVFDEDLGSNAPVRALLDEYALRKYRL